MTSADSQGRVRPDKVTLIAVWFGINAAISLFLVAVLLFVFGLVLPDTADDPDRGRLVIAAFRGVGVIFGVVGVLDIAAVVGLLRLREWGRWLAMILAVLGLILIPIHTIVGALIIWYLLSDEAKHAFGALEAAEARR